MSKTNNQYADENGEETPCLGPKANVITPTKTKDLSIYDESMADFTKQSTKARSLFITAPVRSESNPLIIGVNQNFTSPVLKRAPSGLVLKSQSTIASQNRIMKQKADQAKLVMSSQKPRKEPCTEVFLQTMIVNYQRVLIRQHKKKVSIPNKALLGCFDPFEDVGD